MIQNFSQSEILSLMFYQGADITAEDLSIKPDLKDFYQVENAYEGLNMLLFPGTENERARLIAESRTVDTLLLNHVDEILQVYDDLYTAMCKYTYDGGNDFVIHTWRYDRAQSLQILQNGETGSFFSTSVVKKTSDYFKMKRGLLILEIEASPETVHLSTNDILGSKSKYPKENEILFPPYSGVILEQLELTKEELTYEDQDKKPPVGKYKIRISNNLEVYQPFSNAGLLRTEKARLLSVIMEDHLLENAKKVWKSYNLRKEPEADTIKDYIEWKNMLQTYVRIRQREIYQKIFGRTDGVSWKRKELLNECIECIRDAGFDANRKREEYEKKLIKQNILLAVLQGIAAFFIALSMLGLNMDELILSDVFKILGIGLTLTAFTIYRIFNGLSISGKMRQRTQTYLKLDELNRDIRFTSKWTDADIACFIERYKQIIHEDNLQCVENTDQFLKLLDEIGKSGPGKLANDIDK